MLMVDFVTSFTPGAVPILEAGRHVSLNETIFEGHFPGLPIWPGALTIEGLGQTATLLRAIATAYRHFERSGRDPDEALEAFRNLDRGARMHPGYRADEARAFVRALREHAPRLAVGASVEMKFVQPVFAGCRLDYRAEWTDDLGDLMRFSVEASVEGRTVAKGTITGANVDLPGLWSDPPDAGA